MKMKKIITVILALTLSMLLLVGCGSNGDSEDTSNGNETESTASEGRQPITMWFWGAATDYQETMKDVLAGWYNNSQDEYELVIEFRNTVDTDIPVALSAHNAPDIVYASGPSYTQIYQDEGLVLNLDSYAEQYGWKDRVLGVIYDALTVDGSLYSTPGGMLIGGLYYNKDIFEKNSWDVPTTWDEMLELFEKADAEGMYPLGAGNKGWKPCNDHFSSMIINHYSGADVFYNVLTGKESFDNERMIEGVEKTKEWYDKGYLSGDDYVNLDSQEVIQLLADERCAMVMAPSLYTQFVGQSFVGDDVDKVGFAPMPSYYIDEDIYDVSINCNFSINADSEYPDECAKILDYMLTAEYAVNMTKGWPGYWTVPVTELVDYDSSDLTGLAQMTIESFKLGVEKIDEGYFAYHPSTFFPAATLTAYQDIDTVWQGVVSAEDFCKTVAKELNAEIADGAIPPVIEPKMD